MNRKIGAVAPSLFLFLGLAVVGRAADTEYMKVGAWSIRAITNADGTLNRCAAHLTGPTGFLRIAATPNMKTWSLSVPGTSPQLPLKAGSKVWSEMVTFGADNSMNAGNPIFNVDASAGRASIVLDADQLKEVKGANTLSVKLFNRADACDSDKNCPSKTFEWKVTGVAKALAAIPACIKAN